MSLGFYKIMKFMEYIFKRFYEIFTNFCKSYYMVDFRKGFIKML